MSCLIRIYLLAHFSFLMGGCALNKAIVNVQSVDSKTRMPLSGNSIRDARSNQYLMLSPGQFTLEQWNDKPIHLPLILTTQCGNLYYQLTVIDKWVKADTIMSDHKANNIIVFEIDKSKEQCSANSF